MDAVAAELRARHAVHEGANLRIRAVPLHHDVTKGVRPAAQNWESVTAEDRATTPGFFATMGTRLLAGREFLPSDLEPDAAPVIVVDEVLARKIWGDESPVGRLLQVEPSSDEQPLAEVVGVVEHVPMSAYVGAAADPARFSLLLMSIFGGVALLLAGLGIASVIALGVGERRRELAIRLALGELPGELVRRFVGEGCGSSPRAPCSASPRPWPWDVSWPSFWSASSLGGAQLARAVEVLASRGKLVVYLDDAESLQRPLGGRGGDPEDEDVLGQWRDDDLRAFWSALVAAAEDDGPLGVVASSRYRPEGTPEPAVLALEPMSRWEVVRLMTWTPALRRVPHGERDWLADKVDGHPRTVEYLEVLAHEHEKKRMPGVAPDWRAKVLEPLLAEAGVRLEADLLLPRVWEALDEDAREHLGRLSVLSGPAPGAAIAAVEPSAGCGRRLIDTGLLSPFPVGSELWWAPHRLVTETVRGLWTGSAEEAHRRLGGWFQAEYRERKVVVLAQRAVEHLCAAGDQAQGDLVGAREKLERSLHIKASVFGTEEHPEVAASLHSLAGVLQAQGDLPGARELYERVLAVEEKIYGTREHYSTAITEMTLGGGGARLPDAFQPTSRRARRAPARRPAVTPLHQV